MIFHLCILYSVFVLRCAYLRLYSLRNLRLYSLRKAFRKTCRKAFHNREVLHHGALWRALHCHAPGGRTKGHPLGVRAEGDLRTEQA